SETGAESCSAPSPEPVVTASRRESSSMSKSSHSGSGSEVARLATALSGARSLTRADTAKALARLTTGARAERDGLRFEIRVDGVCADIIEMIASTDTTALRTVTIRVRQKRLVPIMHPSQRRKRQLVVLRKRHCVTKAASQ